MPKLPVKQTGKARPGTLTVKHSRCCRAVIVTNSVLIHTSGAVKVVLRVTSKSCLLCSVNHVHSPDESRWGQYQKEYGYKQTGYGPQGSHNPPDSRQPKTSIFGGLKDAAGDLVVCIAAIRLSSLVYVQPCVNLAASNNGAACGSSLSSVYT